ncbi:MAG: DNA-protecting protein DprA [Planctomycetes bacterium]|nr:DNA-protecting protein DprA [Planctomycetota bacterium]
MDDLVDLVTLNMTLGVGAVVFRKLRAHFGGARAILEAKESELRRVEGVPSAVARAISRERGDGESEVAQAEKLGIGIVPCDHPQYPRNLLAIYDPPLVLYVRGRLEETDVLSLGVIGSRRCSSYGSAQALRFASELSQMGFTIVSGLAQGIDTAAHEGALRAEGRTLAVLGCGLCKLYPRQNLRLAEKIAGQGAVISEFPLRTPVDPRHFPQRNRVISGLSLGIVVIEATKESGTLITARWALEQGREVFALPGRVDSPTSQGTHALIQKGAKLVTCPGEMVEELGPLAETVQLPGREPVSTPRELMLNARERQVYNRIGSEPVPIDEIIVLTGLPAPVVASTLTILEIKQAVKQLAGKRYVRG